MSKIDELLWEKSMAEADKLADQNWNTDVIEEKLPDGTTLFVARNLELERCIAQGETPEEALEELKKATHVHLAASLYYNLPIPKPKKEVAYAFEVYSVFYIGNWFDGISQMESIQTISLSTIDSIFEVANHLVGTPRKTISNLFLTTTIETLDSGSDSLIVNTNDAEIYSTTGQKLVV